MIPSNVEILQQLIRFDTTNPPGNEQVCANYIREILTQIDCECQLIAKTPQRPNLMARLAGNGKASPLLLYGHMDVVPTTGQQWKYPPFEGRIVDGYLWGRGAIDMKGPLAMLLGAFIRAKIENADLPGDVIFCALSDEEVNGNFGARFMVEEHPDLFEGVRFALGEIGGFSTYLGSKYFYPIMVAEKQVCWMRAKLRGPGGHASIPIQGGAMNKLARLILALERKPLPVHITTVVRQMITEISDAQPQPIRMLLRMLLWPSMTNSILKLLGTAGKPFSPLLHNTVCATIVRTGDSVNVIPSEISLDLDGRLLPGFTAEDMIAELRMLADKGVEFEVIEYQPCPPEPDMGMFNILFEILRKNDPDGHPVPMMLMAVTDARYFAHLGIQTYGYTPAKFPEDFNFLEMAHAADERIPVDAVDFGVDAIYQALIHPRP